MSTPSRRPSLPGFLLEVGGPRFTRRLRFSVRSGLAIALAFGLIVLWAASMGVIPWSYWYLLPVGLKLLTNGLAWWTLRRQRWVLEGATLNVVTDVLVLTWAIYLSGGPFSPLFGLYSIELTVVPLLSNLGTTLLVSLLAMLMYTAMVLLVVGGVLPPTPPLATVPADLTPGYLALHFPLFAFVLAVPTFFTAAILQRLRAKQQMLLARTDELVEASRARAQFLANVTHELRTPIHGIRGLTQLLASGIYGEPTDKQKRAHDEIARSAESLLALVDDLLVVATADAGRLSYEATDVDLREVVDRLTGTTRGLVGTRALGFEVSVRGELPVVRTDRRKLTQALLNLLANAVKFTPDGGKVEFRALREARSVVFEIEDDGPGIPEAELGRVFLPFHQVDGTHERHHGGVGLGLALVQELAETIGATVSVRSRVGFGSTFTLILPDEVAPPLEPSSGA